MGLPAAGPQLYIYSIILCNIIERIITAKGSNHVGCTARKNKDTWARARAYACIYVYMLDDICTA